MKYVKRIAAILLVCLLLSGGAYALNLFSSGKQQEGTIAVTEAEYALLEKYRRLEEIQAVIDNKFLWEYDEEALLEGAAQGMLRALGDNYSFYYTPEQYETQNEALSGEYGGLGIEIFANFYDDTITIKRVFYGGPAQQVGIRPVDKIIAVNGEEMRAADINKAVSIMRGEVGGEVTVTILRDQEVFDVTLERAIVQTEIIQYEMLADDIGYLRVFYFEGNLHGQLQEAIAHFQEAGAKALVIDLRDNPGGYLHLATAMADIFLPDGAIIMQTQDKYGRSIAYTAYDDAWEIPVAILQNGTSASAAEILSVALQENGVATVVGTQSFGKGIMQTVFPFEDDGAGMQLTSEYWLSPTGQKLHETGVTPDVEVELAEDAINENYEYVREKDNQLHAAVEALLEQLQPEEEAA